jgi:hypothetical protein
VTPLAYVLIVVIPLAAFVTVALALLPGRGRPGRGMDTAQISARIGELDAELDAAAGTQPGGATPGGRPSRDLRQERRRLHDELLRRGHGRSV